MSSVSVLSAAVILFIVVAILYYQSVEGFTVPADLNTAPIATPTSRIPSTTRHIAGIPGAMTAPNEAMATFNELRDLNDNIMTWLGASAQKERSSPNSLTPEQKQQAIVFQARIANIRQQLASGVVTDTSDTVNKEILDVRQQNSGWAKAIPDLDSVEKFAEDAPKNSWLTSDQYVEFRAYVESAIKLLGGQTQPDPLQRVRLQQLQVLAQEMDQVSRTTTPSIRVGTAQNFLKQMLKPDQPLPSIFTMETSEQPKSLKDSPTDVINYLKDIQWKCTISKNPLSGDISNLLKSLQSGKINTSAIPSARNSIAEFQNKTGPCAFGQRSYAPIDRTASNLNPNQIQNPAQAHVQNQAQRRAELLCKQVEEAFPTDSVALGCPLGPITTESMAENTINTVCERIRVSAPSVTPAQFNCPPTSGWRV